MPQPKRVALSGLALSVGAAALWVALAALLAAAPAHGAPAGKLFTVNSAADVPDAAPGDGTCETAHDNHVCTLRGAIQEANHWPGADTIQLQANTTYLLSRSGVADDTALRGDLDITDSVSLLGAGAGSSLIDGGALTPTERVLDIRAGDVVVISGVSVQHGQSINFGGGGIRNQGRLELTGSAILSNSLGGSVNESGAGLLNAGWLTLTRSLVAGNATGNSDAAGGGVFNDGYLYVRDSTIRANATYSGAGGAGFGGGVSSQGPATIVNSTISENYAAAGGGLRLTAAAVLINTTVSNNTSGGRGSGLDCSVCGQVQLFNTTITGNLANENLYGGFGGVAMTGGTLDLNNSLLAFNLTKIAHTLRDDDCYIAALSGTINAIGSNLITYIDPAHCVVSGAPLADDPLLGPLQDNGGPTFTHALLPGSPAIDAGPLSGCTDNLGATLVTDQRGLPRAANINGVARCDLGAYELQRTLSLPLLVR